MKLYKLCKPVFVSALLLLFVISSLHGCTTASDVNQKSPFVNIEGAVNVRDIGGYATDSGKTVKRGMIFRGSEIDGLFEPYVITENGREFALKTLHIRSDFDLRGSTINPLQNSYFGNHVRYYCFNIESYNHVFSSQYMDNVAALFHAFADASNYPVYLHCTYGLDRTGTVCYLLEALLGMSREDINSEYRLSFEAFPQNAENTASYDSFTAYFSALEGETYREKAEGYLISCGVSEEDMMTIRNILTE